MLNAFNWRPVCRDACPKSSEQFWALNDILITVGTRVVTIGTRAVRSRETGIIMQINQADSRAGIAAEPQRQYGYEHRQQEEAGTEGQR